MTIHYPSPFEYEAVKYAQGVRARILEHLTHGPASSAAIAAAIGAPPLLVARLLEDERGLVATGKVVRLRDSRYALTPDLAA